MLNKAFLILLIIIIIAFGSCTKQNPNPVTVNQGNEFEFPDIPSVITDSVEIASYLATHYWDKYDFADTCKVLNSDNCEIAFREFIILLHNVPNDIATHSIKKMITKSRINKTVFLHFGSLYERYLYDPTSPYRNDELLIPVLEEIVSSKLLDASQKVRPAFQLSMALKNRVGMKATDLNLLLHNGKNNRIYECNAQYTLLFFYNPDCHTCQETIIKIKNSELLSDYIRNEFLKIVAIYTDYDKKAWLNYQSNIPETWINGWLHAKYTNQAKKYDLKASPTLYLLGKDKTVLLKDATFEQITDYLSRINQK